MDSVGAPRSFSFADLQVLGKNKPDNPDNLREAVVQFESLFVNMMLKSMRDANAVLAEGSYLSSSEIQMHQQMLDQQMAVHLSEQGGIGLAEPLMRQLGGGLDSGQADTQSAQDQPLVLSNPSMAVRQPTLQQSQPEQTVLATSVAEVENANPEVVEQFDTPADFVRTLLPTFTEALADSPINPMTALAQAALETGWGAHQMQQASGKPAHNLFGIKASNWSGPTAQAQTMEFLQGQPIQKVDSFRAYDDWSQSVRDYANLIGGSDRYAGAIEQAQDPAAYLNALKDAGYATDPNYAGKILSVLDRVKQLLSR